LALNFILFVKEGLVIPSNVSKVTFKEILAGDVLGDSYIVCNSICEYSLKLIAPW